MALLPSWKRRTAEPAEAPEAAPRERAGRAARPKDRKKLLDVRNLLSPEILRQISPLTIASRQVMEGSVAGAHRSPYKSFSVEFADHRPYVRGDDTRHLDWRLYGRSERYYVKQYEAETNMRVYILLDCSKSMSFRSPRAALTKYEYACHLAAALGFIVVQQTDAVGLVLFDEGVRELVAPRSGLGHLREMIERMAAVDPTKGTDSALALHSVAEAARRRALLIVLSDLLDEPEAVTQAIAHFRHRRHDVVVFQILDDHELQFPYAQTALFEDMETGERLRLSPKAIAAEYRAAVAALVEGYRKACFDCGADYRLVDTSRPHTLALREYLARRERRG